MIRITKSFAECLSCPLLSSSSCIYETNTKNLCDVEIIFIAENPGKTEVLKERPLVGISGKIFRKFFEELKLNKYRYLITNTVLCQTLTADGKTGNPTDEVINLCKENCFNIIRATNPKLVVLFGTTPMKAFDIGDSAITKRRGQLYKWENFDIFLSVHPSFVNRNKRTELEKFKQDFEKIREYMGGNKIVKKIGTIKDKKGIHRYKIPEEFYSDNYRLVDIQHMQHLNKVIYIFRDKENKKIFHEENDDFYCYQVPHDVKPFKIVPYEKLNIIKTKPFEARDLNPNITYENDIRICTKHAMDYYHFNKEEAPLINQNIYFIDIEIDTGEKNREFPSPIEAKYPINMITIKYHDKLICYVLDNKIEKINNRQDCCLEIFQSEKNMMLKFIKDFKSYDPDFISGYNSYGFDFLYIFNRLMNLGIDPKMMSRFKKFFIDPEGTRCYLGGCVPVDQLSLYRFFTFTQLESNTLGNVSQHELGTTKVQMEYPINEMYYKDINKLIEYNIKDTELLYLLEEKLKHINLLNEIRTICKASFTGGSSTFGQVDSLVVSYLRERGLSSKCGITRKKVPYPGGYVHAPVPGVYDFITDFDFTSLYPSLIMTYNIGVNNFFMKLKNPYLGYDLSYNKNKLPEKIEVIMNPTYNGREGNKIYKRVFEKEELITFIEENNLIHTINGCFFIKHEKELSYYALILSDLLSSRNKYKSKMFEAKEKQEKEKTSLYNTRQLVYKVLANSLYGVIANKAFRFFDLSCASAITLSGQEATKTSIIEGNEFMRVLNKEDEYRKPEKLTKMEAFGDISERKTDYIVTADTDSLFCCFEKFKNINKETILNYCGKIQDFLNKIIMKELTEKHNVTFEYNKLNLKNELLINRGLFLAKKRYSIWVTGQEGREIDSVHYMGLEVKRSDYSSETKMFLKKLIDMVLKSEKISIIEIMKYIEEEKKRFIGMIKAGDKKVARPVAFTKKLEEYKAVPQGVKSMLAFNKIAYSVHVPGSRGYMFTVKGLDKNIAPPEIVKKYEEYIVSGEKLSAVTIPDEEEKLPEYFIPDVPEMLRFSFIDRYMLLLDPLLSIQNSKGILKA